MIPAKIQALVCQATVLRVIDHLTLPRSSCCASRVLWSFSASSEMVSKMLKVSHLFSMQVE